MAKIIEHEILNINNDNNSDVIVSSSVPYEYLDYNNYKNAFYSGCLIDKIATVYNETKENIAIMASDPDHGGRVTISSLIEAMVAFELERDGVMGISILRGPKRTDLKDGWNRLWDVKAPPRVNGMFDINGACKSIFHKFSEFTNNDIGIFLCVSFMNLSDYSALLSKLDKELDSNKKYHIRQINIEGVL